MLTLYHNNLSVCAQKVRFQLEEKGIAREERYVDLLHGEHLKPEFLKLNPRGLVPALVHGDVVVIESTVILEYIEDVFPEPPLRPAAPAHRAQMRVWQKLPDDGLHVACGTISFAAAFAQQLLDEFGAEEIERRLANMPDQDRANRQRLLMKEGFNAPFVRQAVGVYERVLDEMEAALQKFKAPYLVDGRFTLAEVALVPYLERLQRLGLGRMWEGRRPQVSEWFERVRDRAGFKAAFDAYKPRDYDDLVREKGVELWPRVEPLLRKASR